MGSHCNSAREKIIDAAEDVVIERGARHLTFDAVAAKSGVSRGGLLYHFPDKDALLRAMLERAGKQVREARARKQTELSGGKREDTVSASILGFLEEGVSARKSGAAALFAIGAHRPELLSPLKDGYRAYVQQLAGDRLSLERAAIVALATDGLRFLELLSMSPFSDDERTKIAGELLALAKETTRPSRKS